MFIIMIVIIIIFIKNVNGILADEMGLGKTIQTIAFLVYLSSKSSESNKPRYKERESLYVRKF